MKHGIILMGFGVSMLTLFTVFSPTLANENPQHSDSTQMVLKALLDEVGINYEITPPAPAKKQKQVVQMVKKKMETKKEKQSDQVVKKEVNLNPLYKSNKDNPLFQSNKGNPLFQPNTEWNQQLADQDAKYKDWLKEWDEKYKAKKKEWGEQNKLFVKNMSSYKNNLVDYDDLIPPEAAAYSGATVQKVLSSNQEIDLSKTKYFVVPGAMDVPIRDQGRRGTCAAFTAVRAIETALYEQNVDLSEHYFYWSSKPKCQSNACSKSGSWYGWGLDFSKKSEGLNIPLEQSCPYNSKKVKGNETQIPLPKSCFQGTAKVTKYHQVKPENYRKELHQNRTILSAFKLSPNFFKTKGFVRYSEEYEEKEHASGHALLIVGYVQLPKAQHSKEGKLCYIVANSWTEGWGKGGYSCLSEKWVDKYDYKKSIVISQVEMR